MNFDITTLAFITSITYITQIIALLVQYFVNKSYRGVIWWLLGSTFWAVGVIFMPMISIKSMEFFVRISNPLVILGHIFLYIGMMRFLSKKENKIALSITYILFLIFYYYFMFVNNDISSRTVVINIVSSSLSFLLTAKLVFYKDKQMSVSANFTALMFFLFGLFSLTRIYFVFSSPPIQTYHDQWTIVQLSFIIPIVTSLLWTFGFIIMVNQRLNQENREEREKLELIFNTSPDAAIISRLADGTIIDVNAGFLSMTGYSQDEVINNTISSINIWQNKTDRENFLKDLRVKGLCENQEFKFQRKDGNTITGRVSAKIISIQLIPHILSVVHDITKNKQAEEALRESEELYRSILNASPDDITITDMQGSILVVSPAAKKIFGYEPEFNDFIGSHLVDYIVPDDRDRAKSNIKKMLMGESAGPNEYLGLHKDGSTFNVEVNSGLIQNLDRQPSKMVFIVRDITERKQTEKQIQSLVKQLEIEKETAQQNANTDSLTGLSNRRFFDEVLRIEFRRSKRSKLPISLIMLDVDYFKKYNDLYGHLAGDDCLRKIGETLRTHVGRAADFVARYGGEEFVAILTDTDQAGAAILSERIRLAIEDMAIPHNESDISKYITVSLGVATVFTTRLKSPEQILALADVAMYSAKRAGRNQISFASEATVLEDL